MGTLGIFATRFNVNTKSLEAFDEALRFLKKKEYIKKMPEAKANIDKLLEVVSPIVQSIEGNLSESTAIDETSVGHILRERHDRDWPSYKKKLKQLYSKLNSNEFELLDSEFNILNDIADALDVECGNLFRRMSKRI